MKLAHFLIAIRYQNLFIIWLMQSVIYFKYVLPYCGKESYSFLEFILFLISTGAVLSAGNVFNDIRDVHTDSLHPNKHGLIGSEISIKQAWSLYYVLNGVMVIVVLAGVIIYHWPILLAAIFLLTSGALILYSNHLKSTILTGNLVVALLCGLAVWITTLLFSSCSLSFMPVLSSKIPLIIYGYIGNAIIVTLLREIIKDKEDADWDIQSGILTVGSLPEMNFRVLFNMVLACCIVYNGFWFWQLRSILNAQNWNLGIVFIFGPLALIALIFNLPHKPGIYSFLSKLIKVHILFAILLLILWQRG